ncbi:MAG: single-stranded-DNA-specific exonuclease RecJ [Lachnospiraceae bacterium]|nr:single-stranded-DNA-specific exonuclease RecJ [Lachnospiraceae bacterium]
MDGKLPDIGAKWNIKNRWVLRRRSADYAGLSQRLGIDQVAIRIMLNRGIDTEEGMHDFLYMTLKDLHDGALLPDVAEGVKILRQKIKEAKPIRVMGDYDVDGITGTYILFRVLSFLHPKGEEGVSVDIPERTKDGYGLNERLIRKAGEDGIDTVVTVDNGIAASAPIALAKSLGMTVIVTDHHEVPYDENGKEILPAADAVIDPKREGSDYPFREICGAVVAFKVCQQLMGISNATLYDLVCEDASPDPAAVTSIDMPVSVAELKNLLHGCMEMCALATNCDVMPLIDENRPILRTGLKLMEHSAIPGFASLIKEVDLKRDYITGYDLSFRIGPCLNSSGRLESALEGLALLMETDGVKAQALARKIFDLNTTRKSMMQHQVDLAVDMMESDETEADSVLVIYLPECHESLAGLVASRLKDRYNRPVLVATNSEEEGKLKGSARSVEGYQLYDALHEVRDLLTNFGGHAMAAGFGLEKEKLSQLRERLNENADFPADAFDHVTVIDADMGFDYISERVITDIERLEPFGQGNPKPVFGLVGLSVLGQPKVYGQNRNVAKCVLKDARGNTMDAVYFGEADRFAEDVKGGTELQILYTPTVDRYYATARLQVVINEYKVV